MSNSPSKFGARRLASDDRFVDGTRRPGRRGPSVAPASMPSRTAASSMRNSACAGRRTGRLSASVNAPAVASASASFRYHRRGRRGGGRERDAEVRPGRNHPESRRALSRSTMVSLEDVARDHVRVVGHSGGQGAHALEARPPASGCAQARSTECRRPDNRTACVVLPDARRRCSGGRGPRSRTRRESRGREAHEARALRAVLRADDRRLGVRFGHDCGGEGSVSSSTPVAVNSRSSRDSSSVRVSFPSRALIFRAIRDNG